MLLKKILFVLVFFVVLSSFYPIFSPADANPPTVTKELNIKTGYFRGHAKHNPDFQGVPFSLQILYKINEKLNLESHPGSLFIGVEPFLDFFAEHRTGVLVGLGLTAKYLFPLNQKISAFFELSSGPSYFGMSTIEQGHAGFNFRNQGGVGLTYHFSEKRAINFGYYLQHLSHADTRGKPNGGIDTQALIVGYSIYF